MFTKDVYKDEQAPAFALLAVTLRKYGTAILEEEPEFIRMQIENDYLLKLSDLQSDKLQAAITIMITDHFQEDWRVLETCCHLLSNQPVEHDVLNPLDPEQLAIGLAEFRLIKADTQDDNDQTIFSDEVRAYIGHIMHEYGFHRAPSLFPIAIMPASAPADDVEKNEALNEVYRVHIEYVLDYLSRIT